MNTEKQIAIIGLGYVGLPLAVEFSKKYKVIGFDIHTKRVNELREANDKTLEVAPEDLKKVLVDKHQDQLSDKVGLFASDNVSDISSANIYIVTVPTPIDANKRPDLRPLLGASSMISKVLKKGDIVIYESTVYPGCTEEDCVPVLEQSSGLVFNQDFFCGYSPERINPGDKINTLATIKKVTSGSTPDIAVVVDKLYKSIITAGTHLAPSIKVAEASKAIENAQRDVNISFVNELALIFDRMNINTHDVLEAAATKWNFLPFKPGLVGGHCISVDPYYLAYKAESLGYHPAVILSGRRVNDQMGAFVATKVIKLMIQKGIQIKGAKVLILGITFKENCPDIRNTKVVDIYKELITYNTLVDIYDPLANKEDVKDVCGIDLTQQLDLSKYQAFILAVSHKEFEQINFINLKNKNTVIFDTKAAIDLVNTDARL
ncbi:nucleotide sugar dehydrogenase [Flavobacteriales bacterium]|nr:nucleotide sugar dehydrogenase [Flavobacteriales bacterium]